jgi:uncharacterized protein YjiS (DUF1127 family)
MCIITNTYTQELDMFSKLKQIVINLDKMQQRQKAVRSTIKELSALTDRELNDIGINRSMIRYIAEQAE